MALKRHNLVTFNADGTRIVLTLEGPFVQRCGVQPNDNRATVTIGEFDKLGTGQTLKTRGSIEFWYRNKPGGGDPDHVIQGVRIFDAEPVSAGKRLGEGAARVDEVRLYLTDFRERFVPPRGGLLTQGELNDPKLGPDSAALKTNSQLVAMAMEALGIAPDSFNSPSLLDRIGPPRSINWNGTPAGPELAKLLQHANAVLCPQSNGAVIIEAAGTANVEPDFNSMEQLPALKLPGLGRRGKTIIISSAPFPVVDLRAEKRGPDTWEFVAQDIKERLVGRERVFFGYHLEWKALDQVSILNGQAPGLAVARDFDGVNIRFRDALRSQVYHCIRLSEKLVSKGLSPVLRVGAAGEQYDAPQVYAKIPVWDSTFGMWKNSAEFVKCDVTHMTEDPGTVGEEGLLTERVPGQYIFHVRQRLMRHSGSDNILFPDSTIPWRLRELNDEEIFVAFTQEVRNGDKREFFTVGFRQTTDGVEELKGNVLASAIATADADTVFVQEPRLRLRRVAGEDQNRDELVEEAKKIAQAYLEGSGDDYEIRTVKGFVGAELSGKVTEIAWDQESLTTTFKLNGWHYPLGASGDRQLLKDFQEAFRRQHESASERASTGGSSAGQASVPMTPSLPRNQVEDASVLKLIGEANTGGDDGAKYAALVLGRRATTTNSGNLSMPEGMQVSPTDQQVIAINPEEDGQNTHLLEIPSYVCAVPRDPPLTENGVPVYVIVGLRYKTAAPSLGDTQSWSKTSKGSGDQLGDTGFSRKRFDQVVFDTDTGDWKQWTYTQTFDAGGRLISETAKTLESITPSQNCAGGAP